jgi:hypothetical protein
MAYALTLNAPKDWKAVQDEIPAGLSRTDRVRRLLKCAGRPLTAAEIAWDLEDHFPNFGSHLVWLLLKHDMQKGRVIFEEHKYRWNHEYDTAEAAQIRAAASLLRKNGYQVSRHA